MGYIRHCRGKHPLDYRVKRCEGQSHAFRKHAHSELAISLITRGRSEFGFVRERFNLKAGQLVVIGPGLVHQCIPEDVAQWGFYMVYVPKEWLDEAGFSEATIPEFSARDLDEQEYAAVLRAFEALCALEDGEEELFSIVEAAVHSPGDYILDSTPEHDDTLMQQVGMYIQSRLSETIRIDDLAEQFGLNKYALIRSFHNRYNATPHVWQNILRLEEAKRMLESGAAIAETAIAMGFYDQSHFAKAFKESFGITPGKAIRG